MWRALIVTVASRRDVREVTYLPNAFYGRRRGESSEILAGEGRAARAGAPEGSGTPAEPQAFDPGRRASESGSWGRRQGSRNRGAVAHSNPRL